MEDFETRDFVVARLSLSTAFQRSAAVTSVFIGLSTAGMDRVVVGEVLMVSKLCSRNFR